MFLELLTLSATMINFFIALYFIFLARRNVMADIYLGVLLLLFSLTFLFNYFGYAGIFESNPELIFLDIGIPFLLGPVTWYYVISLTHIQPGLKFDRFLHLVPGIIIYVVFLDIVFLPPEKKLELLQMPASEAGIRHQVHTILQLISVPVYLIVSLGTINNYQKQIRRTRSAIKKLSHRWLRLFLVIFLLFWLIISTGLILANFFPSENTGFLIFTIGTCIFSLFIGIYGILRNKVTKNLEITDFELSKTEKRVQEVINRNRLDTFMEDRKPFLEPELTLHQLADMIGIQAHVLSSVLNVEYKQSFFDFINERRINEFKERVKNGAYVNFSILAIAYDSGFNSKTAFYRFFKKTEGYSPGEFIRIHKEKSN